MPLSSFSMVNRAACIQAVSENSVSLNTRKVPDFQECLAIAVHSSFHFGNHQSKGATT